jgi:tRNA(fMet)-specific endonuclease VapC
MAKPSGDYAMHQDTGLDLRGNEWSGLLSLFVLDTDMLSLYQHGHAVVCQNVEAHAPSELAISVITVEEQLTGWYTQLRRAKKPAALAQVYRRLAETVQSLSRLQILLYTVAAIARYNNLRAQKLNIGKMDLRIAAIALELQATVVSRNRTDFQRVPNLPLADWSQSTDSTGAV